jgi:hypothetical protein
VSSINLCSAAPLNLDSGDDRDYCEITHVRPATGQEIREITVKSFSPTQHIERPGFQLLSLIPDGPGVRQASTLCLLPSARSPITHIYLPFLLINVLVIFVWQMKVPYRGLKEFASPLPLSATDTSFKLKDGPHAPSGYFPSSFYQSDSYVNSLPGAALSLSLGDGNTYRSRTSHSGASRLLSPEPNSPYSPRSLNGAAPTSSPVAARRPRLRMPFVDTDRGEDTEALWTWTFTFRGQRRRFAVRALRAAGMRNSAWWAILRDLRRTLWFPFGVWAFIMWLFT